MTTDAGGHRPRRATPHLTRPRVLGSGPVPLPAPLVRRRDARSPVAPRMRMLAVVLGGQAMASLDGSIVNVATPSIRDRLPATGAQLQLVSTGYLLAFAALVVTAARLGDRWGRARMFRLGLAAFTAASLSCGLAPDAAALVASRAVQGAAGALMVAQVIALIQARFDGATRARAFGAYSMVLALGVAAGQIVGGLLVTADVFGLGWRPVFLVNVPAGVALLVAAARVLRAGPEPEPERARFDVTGVVLLAAAVSAVVTPLTLGREAGWPAWSLALLVAGSGGVVAFVRHELRLGARPGGVPLLDLRRLRRPGLASGLAACCLAMGTYAVFVFTLTLHLQGGLGFTPLRAGLSFVPYAAGFAVTSTTWPRIPARRLLPVLGPLVLAAAATAVVLGSGRQWPTLPAGVLLALAGAGHAASFGPLLARLGVLVGARFASSLSGLTNTGTLLAGAVAIAGLGGLYLSAAAGGAGTPRGPVASHAGLLHVVLAADAVLLVTAACAAWAVTRPDPGP